VNMLEKILEEIENLNYYPEGMGCGIEDCGITDIYEACEYGWNQAIEAAIEVINNMDDGKDINVLSKRLIDEQPTVCTGDGWIPYTEQSKPKKDGIYLVTCDDEEYPVKRMRFKECLWYWTYGIYDGKILAWQPLPEPYKGEEAAGE